MTEKEAMEYCSFLFEQVQEKDKQMSSVLSTHDEIKEELSQARSENKQSHAEERISSTLLLQEISQLRNQLKESKARNESLERQNKTLSDRLAVLSKEYFGGTSQKGITTSEDTKWI